MVENTQTKLLAFIREEDCIGCTKCIQACPVDAILGSRKSMHTIISDICTGCELCVSPCPAEEAKLAILADERTRAREQRLAQQTQNPSENFQRVHQQAANMDDKKAFIAEAISRAKLKKNSL